MPDDSAAIEEEVAEQPPVIEDDFAQGFDDEPEDNGGDALPDKKDKGDGASKDKDDTDAAKHAEKKEVKETPPAEKTAKERIEERLKDVKEVEEKEPEVTPKADPPAAKPSSPLSAGKTPLKEQPPPSGALTKEQIAEYLSSVEVEELPDGQVIIGNETVDLREYARAFPDEFNAIKVIASTIAQKMIQPILAKGESPEVQKTIDGMKQTIGQLMFDVAVNEAYPGWRKTVATDDFKTWLSEQGKKVQFLASSLDSGDGILVLDYFHEDMSKKKVKEFDDKNRKKKEEVDDIHKNTMRQKKTPPAPALKNEIDDFVAGFNDEPDQ